MASKLYRRFPNNLVTTGKIVSTILVGSSKQATMVDSRDSLKSALLRTKELSNTEVANVCDSLCGKTIKKLRVIMKSICVRLTGWFFS